MKFVHRHPVFLSLLLLLAITIAAAVYFTRPQPIAVTVMPVERGSVEASVSNTRAGSVKACRRARLSPSIGGQISALHVQEGQQVAAGALLLELWNDDLKAQLDHARKSATAARSKTNAICLRADEAQRRLARLQPLYDRGAVSEDQLDEARTAASASRAECRASKAADKVSIAQTAIIAAQLERTRLYAPFPGVVAEVNGELHEYLTPSPVGVATLPAIDLIDNGCFYIEAPIDEVDAGRIEVGMPVRVTLDAFGDRAFDGRLRRIADYVLDREKQARTVGVEVTLLKPEAMGRLLAGYSADVEIITKRHDDVLRVPADALLENNSVYVVGNDNIARKRPIEIGLSNWDFVEVTGGLKAGDRIITSLDREGLDDGVEISIENDHPQQ
jgi:HlyD family secretion protein